MTVDINGDRADIERGSFFRGTDNLDDGGDIEHPLQNTGNQ